MRRASLALLAAGCLAASAPPERRLLYVASPGIRNYVEWGGKGVLGYDMDHGHSLVERIASPFDDPGGNVENIKGICASAPDRRLYLTTLTRVASIDLMTGKPLWVIAAILVIVGIVQLIQGQIILGVVLIIIGCLVGPGGYSIFRRRA